MRLIHITRQSVCMIIWSMIMLYPLRTLAEVSVKIIEHSTTQIGKELIYPQYSNEELLDKEFELRKQLKELKKNRKRITFPKIMLPGAAPVFISGYALFEFVDQETPFHKSTSRMVGLGLMSLSVIMIPTALYIIKKDTKEHDQLYHRTDLQHKKILKAIEQRNTIAAMKNANIHGQADRHQDKIKRLKLKKRKPLPYHQRALAGLGLSALIMAKGYTDHKEDPQQSKAPLYIGLSLGSGVALGSIYLFIRAFAEHSQSHIKRSLANNNKNIVNTWIAPSRIDRDWALSFGFQF